MSEKKLITLSSLFLILVFSVLLLFHNRPKTYTLNVENQFTYGKINAPVHMILFEEFACPACQTLNTDVLPHIEKEFLSSGKIKITIVPLAFLEDSLPACTLTLCIQKMAQDHMKPFYDFLFKLPKDDLITFSFRDFVSAYIEEDSALPAPQILQALREDSFADAIEYNIALAKKIYPGDLHLPIILINGKLIKNADLKIITKAINEAL